LVLCTSPVLTAAEPAAPLETNDLLIADFEAPDYGAWKTSGEAFGPGPAHGTLRGQMQVDGFKGKGLANSFYNGDGTTGTLTSPPVRIERKFISFLIGGGKDSENTCMNLLIDGKTVRNATGPNDKPGGTETLAPDYWDVGEFLGKTAVIQIVDKATGGWGHINVDHIVQTDRKPPGLILNAKREFRIERRYLNLPIKNARPNALSPLGRRTRISENEIELADAQPDWWAPMDVSAWRGRTVTLQVDKLPEDSSALTAIEPSDSLKGADDLYREPLRGQFHFRPGAVGTTTRTASSSSGRVSPLLPTQPLRLELGQHALGPRRQPRPRALAGTR
jgi:hypothetical protein